MATVDNIDEPLVGFHCCLGAGFCVAGSSVFGSHGHDAKDTMFQDKNDA